MARLSSRRAEVLAGTPFRSMYEKDIADQLDKEGIEYEYERETIIYIQPAQTRKYNPDFFLPNGIIIEAKGKWTIEDRKKMVNVIEQNPDLDIRMLFQHDNKLNKNAKQRYSTWCDKRNIVYAVGKIPAAWLKEAKDEQSNDKS